MGVFQKRKLHKQAKDWKSLGIRFDVRNSEMNEGSVKTKGGPFIQIFPQIVLTVKPTLIEPQIAEVNQLF